MVIDGVFGPWRPDLPDFSNPGLTVARNVTPGVGSIAGSVTYQPLKSSSLYSSTTMASRPLGSAVGQDGLGNAKVYAGDAEHLYKIDPTDRTWSDMSRSGGYTTSAGERWSSTEYGNLIVFSNYSNEPQYVNKNDDVQFDDLTTLVKARHLAVVRDFLVLGNTYEALDGAVPYRLRWSAFGNPFDFTFSQQTQSDFQDIFEGGAIQAIVGGEAGYILLQRSIVKMTYVGAPLVFQFDQLPSATGKGCAISQSVITVEGKTFFISDDGFYVLQGDQIAPIGSGKIDNYFLNSVDTSQHNFMTVAADPREKLVYWSYVSKDAIDGRPDKFLIFNYQTGEWSEAENSTGFVFNSMSLPWTIDQLDVFGSIDNVPASFDSPIWAGGNAMLWSMDSDGRIYVFGGNPMRGVLETQEQLLIQQLQRADAKVRGDRTNINGVRPFVHGSGTTSVANGYRTRTDDTLTFTEPKLVNQETGFAYFRSQGRFHRFRFYLEGNWSQAVGYQIDASAAGFN